MRPRLVLIPGLGADAALFEPQRKAFPDLVVLPWLDPDPQESLPGYARRMAALVPAGPPAVLGGVSLGGMLAWEMASHVRPDAVLLVASCTTPAAIPLANRGLARLATVLPRPLLRPPPPLRPLVAWAFGAPDGEGRAILEHCMRTASPRFVQWGFAAIMGWRPSPPPPLPVVHVHGAQDRLIPCRRVAATDVIAGAGHLLNVTHAGALNQRIGRLLEDQSTAVSLRGATTE